MPSDKKSDRVLTEKRRDRASVIYNAAKKTAKERYGIENFGEPFEQQGTPHFDYLRLISDTFRIDENGVVPDDVKSDSTRVRDGIFDLVVYDRNRIIGALSKDLRTTFESVEKLEKEKEAIKKPYEEARQKLYEEKRVLEGQVEKLGGESEEMQRKLKEIDGSLVNLREQLEKASDNDKDKDHHWLRLRELYEQKLSALDDDDSRGKGALYLEVSTEANVLLKDLEAEDYTVERRSKAGEIDQNFMKSLEEEIEKRKGTEPTEAPQTSGGAEEAPDNGAAEAGDYKTPPVSPPGTNGKTKAQGAKKTGSEKGVGARRVRKPASGTGKDIGISADHAASYLTKILGEYVGVVKNHGGDEVKAHQEIVTALRNEYGVNKSEEVLTMLHRSGRYFSKVQSQPGAQRPPKKTNPPKSVVKGRR